MSIEVTLGEEKKEQGYPKLMISSRNKRIVLFSKNGEGVTVSGCGIYSIGHYSDTWDMCCFEDYNESITLKNGG